MDEFLAIIKLFAGNFAPRGWAFCNGQLLSIAQNTALFSLLGTTYGGDGVTTFGLPDLRGRIPVGTGQGPGLSNITQGQLAGEANHTLITTEIPAHSHAVSVSVSSGNASQTTASAGAAIATPGTSSNRQFTATLGFNTSTPDTALNPASATAAATGGSQPHNNMQPYLGMNYIICTEGIYPSRP